MNAGPQVVIGTFPRHRLPADADDARGNGRVAGRREARDRTDSLFQAGFDDLGRVMTLLREREAFFFIRRHQVWKVVAAGDELRLRRGIGLAEAHELIGGKISGENDTRKQQKENERFHPFQDRARGLNGSTAAGPRDRRTGPRIQKQVENLPIDKNQ